MTTESPSATPRRELTDVRAMRAITHPVRLALIEALVVDGPMTATKAGEVIGESATTCSFHFRQLARYGFVEEASIGPGRTRTWRLSHLGMRFSGGHDDPDVRTAAYALDEMLRERYFTRLQTYYETRHRLPARWQQVTGASEAVLHVTPDELSAVDAEITAILQRFRDRIADARLRPPDSLPVEVLLFAYPIREPGR